MGSKTIEQLHSRSTVLYYFRLFLPLPALIHSSDFLCPKKGNLKGLSLSPNWKWKKVKGLKDGRFCRDAIPWRGKMCMVNVKGDAAKGALYDTEEDDWEDMQEGMLLGWKGPAAAMDEEVIYPAGQGRAGCSPIYVNSTTARPHFDHPHNLSSRSLHLPHTFCTTGIN